MKEGGVGQDSGCNSKEMEAREDTVPSETENGRDEKTSFGGQELEDSGLQATAREKSRSVSDATSGEAGQPPEQGAKRRTVRQRLCRVPGCGMDVCKLSKRFNMRYRICEDHRRAGVVSINGEEMRFCQMCARFHVLGEFDESRMTCRSKLEEHNMRRRIGNRRKRALLEAEDLKIETEQVPSLPAPGDRAYGGRRVSAHTGTEQMEAGRRALYHGDVLGRQEMAPHGVMAGRGNMEGGLFVPPESANLLTMLIQFFLQQSDTEYHRNGMQPLPPINSSSYRSAGGQARDGRWQNQGVNEEFRAAERALNNAFHQPQSTQHIQWLMQQAAAQQAAAQRAAAQQASRDQEILHRISMKIFGCGPQDLSPGILAEVERLLRVSPGEVSAYTRPGCVNITLDIWTHRHCFPSEDHNFARNFIMSLLPKKSDEGFTIQYLESLVLHENSSVDKVQSFSLQASPIFSRALIGIEPACLIASSVANISLKGECVGLKSTLHLCRQKSRFLKFVDQNHAESKIGTSDTHSRSQNFDSTSQAKRIRSSRFQIQDGIEPGYLEFELEVDFILSKPVPVLVVPDTQLGRAVSEQINSLEHADIFDLIRATGKLVDLLDSKANGREVDWNLLMRLAVYSICTAHSKGLNALLEYIHNHLRKFLDTQGLCMNSDKDFVELNPDRSSWKSSGYISYVSR